MRKFIATLTLTGTLALALLCEAGPRVRKPPPLLTQEETLCHALGESTYDLAIARDSGIPVLKAISILRQALQDAPNAPAIAQLMTAIAQDVYNHPSVPPDMARQAYVLDCLKHRYFAETPSAPTAVKDRY
jgi:hypothetical protein